jgi:flagellar hook-length control protein FliK
MIPQALPANAPQNAAKTDTMQQGGKAASAFALLMQQTTALQSPEGLTTALQPAPAKGALAETMPEMTLPGGIDPETPDGLTALLDHVITELENSGEQPTPTKVLAEVAKALGVEPAPSIVEFAAVAQLEDPALEAVLTERLASAVQTATPISQLSIAAAGVPAVDRTATQATPLVPEAAVTETAPKQVSAAAAPTPLRDLSIENKAPAATPAANSAETLVAKEATVAVPGQSVPTAEGARDLPQPTGNVQLSPEIQRSTPTPERVQAPTTAADDQLRQHVATQIRAVDTSDSKFRFSLSPYGMGEIEVEIGRSETGRVQISMVTETASVLNVLRHDREQLLDALQSRGITAESSDLDFQTFGERGRNDQQQPEGGLTASDQAEAQSDSNETVQVTAPTTGSGSLDILT